MSNVIKSISEMTAKRLLASGDEPHSPVHRIQFMGGTYPDDETAQGGLCETALAVELERILTEIFTMKLIL